MLCVLVLGDDCSVPANVCQVGGHAIDGGTRAVGKEHGGVVLKGISFVCTLNSLLEYV